MDGGWSLRIILFAEFYLLFFPAPAHRSVYPGSEFLAWFVFDILHPDTADHAFDQGSRRIDFRGLDVLSKDGASMVVTALPRHPTMCDYFDSSYRCRTRSPYIARTWKSYSRFVRGYPHTTDNPMRAQLSETRCRAR